MNTCKGEQGSDYANLLTIETSRVALFSVLGDAYIPVFRESCIFNTLGKSTQSSGKNAPH